MNNNNKILNFNSLLRGNETEQELYEVSFKEFGDELTTTEVINISNLLSLKLTEFPKCIQFFVNLEYLYCSYNNLTFIDVSKNINLKELYCSYNNLTFIDVSKNINLKELYCFNNNLTYIDISNNVNLKKLYCHDNSNLPYTDIYYPFERVAEFRSKMKDYIRLQKLNKILV